MNLLRAVIKEIVSLFIDDGNLAAYAVLLITGVAGLPALWGSGLLFVGCIGILFESVTRAARNAKR